MNLKYGDVLVLGNWRSNRKYGVVHTFRFRIDPIPHIGKGSYGHYFRQIKTTQERRKNSLAVKEGIKVRGKRNHVNLPNSYNDIKKMYYKGWKNCTKKRKQYE